MSEAKTAKHLDQLQLEGDPPIVAGQQAGRNIVQNPLKVSAIPVSELTLAS